ncbi:MAG: SAM-dependent chlorinase/fluorinase [Schleiferiaceae bacterium]|nr:SAM-dependent chlorinase/fluorinase [Schleiferiaceae bacterium]
MSLITLTTDYGPVAPHSAALKGYLYQSVPASVRLCELSHAIEPGYLHQAAFLLRHSFRAFPPGSIHLVAVNECCESQRWLAGQWEGHYFLLPDNGLLTMLSDQDAPSAVHRIDPAEAPGLFPARQVLAPAAAHLAQGGQLSLLGPAVQDYRQRALLRPTADQQQGHIKGSVMDIDHYGNLITNIPRALFQRMGHERPFALELPRRQTLHRLRQQYHEASEGQTIALFNSLDLLEIAIKDPHSRQYNGANSMLGIEVGDTLRLVFQ